jgi:hypothetical protein
MGCSAIGRRRRIAFRLAPMMNLRLTLGTLKRQSWVGKVATGWKATESGSIPGRGMTCIPSLQLPDRPWVHQASYIMVTGAVCLGIKRYGREAVHSPPCNADVKNGEAMSPLPFTSSWRPN